MFKKLMKKFNAEIKEVKVENSTKTNYYKLKRCNKCGCTLFTDEIMCPDCLNPIL